MSDIQALRKLWNAHEQITVPVGKFGLISLRMPTAHERGTSWLRSQEPGAVQSVELAAQNVRRLLTAKCVQSWSITPALLLGDLAQGDDAEKVIPVSEEAALFFFDLNPAEFEALANALFEEIVRRTGAEKQAEKN